MTQIAAWYAVLLLTGLIFLPLTRIVFRPFRDGGWMFSRVLGMFLCASFLWALNVLRLLPFLRWAAFLTAGFALVFNVLLLYRERLRAGRAAKNREPASDDSAGRHKIPRSGDAGNVSFRLIMTEEMLFLVIFFAALYFIGFKPEAYGTEKPMDYAFLTAMLRGKWMPFADPWYGGEPVNYYYGGQYITAFLIRLSGVTAGYGYNLMRATITALSFCLPFSLVREASEHYLLRVKRQARTGFAEASAKQQEISDPSQAPERPESERRPRRAARSALRLAGIGGLLGGLAVAFCGNGHYLVYGIILVIKEKLMPGSVAPLPEYPDKPYFYWFPDSTRYIGYYPDTPDKTIHEFPAYSSILGDLHAHYINLIFVLLIMGLLYAWLIRREEAKLRSDPSLRELLGEALLDPVIILSGIIVGLFRWTNFWDFPIYMVVAGAVIFFGQWRKYRRDTVRFFVNILLQGGEIVVLGVLAALPFTAKFDMISSEVLPVTSHTPLYQLAVLWGIPVYAVVLLFLMIMRTFRKEDILEYEDETPEEGIYRPRGFKRLLATIAPEDLIMLIFGVCALGLVLIPELVYVRDIYEGEHYRANTMFKLTYQSFILFGVMLGYVTVRMRSNKNAFYRAAGTVLMAVIVILSTYSVRGVTDWFIPASTNWQVPDASLFLEEHYPTDKGAVAWLNTYVEGQPVVLEAPGDSYSDYGRVSVATGLPTVLGWYVHEWLWRSDPDSMRIRTEDIERIYTSDDEAEIRGLIRKYHISFIYIGKLEREKYGTVNDAMLQKLGTVAYSDGKTTYIMRVG